MVRNTKPSSLCLALSCAKACTQYSILHRQGKCLEERQRPNRSMHFQQAAGRPYPGGHGPRALARKGGQTGRREP